MNEAGYANLMKLVSRAHLEAADTETPHVTIAVARRARRGRDRADRRSRRPDRRALRDGQNPLAEARLQRLKSVFGDRLYVELQRHGSRPRTRSSRNCSSWPTRRTLPLVATNECLLRRARRLRGARRAAVHRRRPLRRRGRPAPAHARALLQERRRDGGAVRRSARGAATTRSRSPSAAPSGRRGASRSCRASFQASEGTTARRARRGWRPPS